MMDQEWCKRLKFNKMYGKLKNQLQEELETIKVSGLYKKERVIVTQHANIQVESAVMSLTFVPTITPAYPQIKK